MSAIILSAVVYETKLVVIINAKEAFICPLSIKKSMLNTYIVTIQIGDINYILYKDQEPEYKLIDERMINAIITICNFNRQHTTCRNLLCLNKHTSDPGSIDMFKESLFEYFNSIKRKIDINLDFNIFSYVTPLKLAIEEHWSNNLYVKYMPNSHDRHILHCQKNICFIIEEIEEKIANVNNDKRFNDADKNAILQHLCSIKRDIETIQAKINLTFH